VEVFLMDITFAPLSLVAGINLVFTLAFQYIPGLRVKFAGLPSETKRALFLGLGIVVAGGWFVATLPTLGICGPALGFVCQPAPVSALISAVAALIIGTGSMDSFAQVIPEKDDVAEAKADRI
jgi:hypothetical protein